MHLTFDLTWKKGQLAHIDRNSSNVDPENVAYLCTPHHDEYDSMPSQTKRFTPAEFKSYQVALYEVLESPDWLRLSGRPLPSGNSKHDVTVELYDRRLPIYRT